MELNLFAPQPFAASELALASQGIAELKSDPRAGFWQALRNADMFKASGKMATELLAHADNFVVAGVGGSSLGARALAEWAPKQNIFFLDHLDPTACERIKKSLNPKRTQWLWISKSGETLETLGHLQWVSQWYKELKLNIVEHSVVISEPGAGKLGRWARENNVRTLALPEYVSGRFSVFTSVGLLPAALMGWSLSEIEKLCHQTEELETLAQQMMCATRQSWQRGEWVTVMWTYDDRLRPFASWWQQLWAESLAKAKTKTGEAGPRTSFPVTCIGSIDQHSILQQIMEGARDKWVWVVQGQLKGQGPKVLDGMQAAGDVMQCQATATLGALQKVGVPTVSWQLDRGGADCIRAMLLLEMVVAALAYGLKINPFDQPGVELGKKLTQDLLRK